MTDRLNFVMWKPSKLDIIFGTMHLLSYVIVEGVMATILPFVQSNRSHFVYSILSDENKKSTWIYLSFVMFEIILKSTLFRQVVWMILYMDLFMVAIPSWIQIEM